MTLDVGESVAGTKHSDFEPLLDRSFASIRLAIELFNRPDDRGRCETVLILLHHAFELLLKAAIVDRKGSAYDEDRGYSFGFDKCLCIVGEELAVLSKDQRRFLSMLDNLRDSAVHYYQLVSEDMLYVFTQGSVSLYTELLQKCTSCSLKDKMAARVLPVTSHPPRDLQLLIDNEFRNLRQAVLDGAMTSSEAVAALRPLMAFSVGAEDTHRRMTTCDLESALDQLKISDDWKTVFPSIAQLRLSTEGEGIVIGVKVVKDGRDAMPVVVIKPGDAVEPQGAIIVKEINPLDKFTMGLKQIAERCGLSMSKAKAIVVELGILEDRDAYHEFRIGSQVHKRYSKKALESLQANLDRAEDIWQKAKARLGGRSKKPR